MCSHLQIRLIKGRLDCQEFCRATLRHSYRLDVLLPMFRLFNELLIRLEDLTDIFLLFFQEPGLRGLTRLELVMYLLNAFIDTIQVIAQASQRLRSISFKFFPKLIKVDVHSLVRQTDFVEHDLADLKNSFLSYHGVALLRIQPELVAGDFLQLYFLGEINHGQPF